MKPLVGFFLVTLTLLSCSGQTTRLQEGCDSIRLQYATLPQIVRHDDYTVVTLANPWKQGRVLHTYVLVSRDKPLPSHLPKGTVIRTPLQRAVVFTTVHSALLVELGCQERIAGVADLKYIKIPYVQQQVKAGRIVDCGDGLSPVVEKIIDVKPDAILLSPFENSGGYGKLEEIDIPLVECAEYMETSPLARAEWMKFYGMLFGVEQKTDSLFAVVDSSYHALQAQAARAGQGRLALVDKMVGSVWYVPGGRSTIGQMIHDACGRYPWSDDTHSGSLSLPFETVLERGEDADVWCYRYSSDHETNYRELLSEHRGYNELKAYRQREVYACNVEQTLFYEETPFRPDYLLGDFIKMVHPEMRKTTPLRYYRKLDD